MVVKFLAVAAMTTIPFFFYKKYFQVLTHYMVVQVHIFKKAKKVETNLKA